MLPHDYIVDIVVIRTSKIIMKGILTIVSIN